MHHSYARNKPCRLLYILCQYFKSALWAFWLCESLLCCMQCSDVPSYTLTDSCPRKCGWAVGKDRAKIRILSKGHLVWTEALNILDCIFFAIKGQFPNQCHNPFWLSAGPIRWPCRRRRLLLCALYAAVVWTSMLKFSVMSWTLPRLGCHCTASVVGHAPQSNSE